MSKHPVHDAVQTTVVRIHRVSPRAFFTYSVVSHSWVQHLAHSGTVEEGREGGRKLLHHASPHTRCWGSGFGGTDTTPGRKSTSTTPLPSGTFPRKAPQRERSSSAEATRTGRGEKGDSREKGRRGEGRGGEGETDGAERSSKEKVQTRLRITWRAAGQQVQVPGFRRSALICEIHHQLAGGSQQHNCSASPTHPSVKYWSPILLRLL